MAAPFTAVRARAATAAAVRPVRHPGAAKQAADARRASAVTMLRGLARTQQSRPVTEVRKLLKEVLTPSGSAYPPLGGPSSPPTWSPAGPSPSPDP